MTTWKIMIKDDWCVDTVTVEGTYDDASAVALTYEAAGWHIEEISEQKEGEQ